MQFTTTLADYRNAIKKKLHISTDQDNSEWSNDYLNDAVNEARRVFWNRSRYRAKYSVIMFNSVASQEDYDISAKTIEDIDVVRYNNGTNKIALKYVALRTFLELTETSQTGDPIVWTLNNKELKLYPAPSAAVANGIELWGTVDLNELDEDADIDTNIEARYKPLIVRYATALAWMEAEQASVANTHFSLFEKEFDEARFDINSSTIGENTPGGISVGVDETDERRWETIT